MTETYTAMNFTEAAIFILLFAIISVPVASRFHLPLEVFLVIGSCIISLIPGLPPFEINPVIVFNLFLPPILFSAAYFTSWHDFKVNARPITQLAFGLVIFTMVMVAVAAKLILPEISWAEGFLLGAIISPTDAASATSIIKKLGAPKRLITILEGESLINDATALILFRFSLAAVVIGSFSFTDAITHFFILSLGGVAIGLIVSTLAGFLIQRIHSVSAETTLTFITAFSCYFLAEHFNVSGIIATVVGGISFGRRFPRLAQSQTRLQTKGSWNTLLFMINGFVFTLIGLELSTILQHLQAYRLVDLIFYGTIISIVVILARLIWVFMMAHLSRKIFPSISKSDPLPSAKVLFVLSWSGMRGIVSLAAALSIPYQIANGSDFPHRHLVIFITYVVIVATLIIPSLSLPLFLKIFNMIDIDNKLKQEATARIQAIEGALETLGDFSKKENIPEPICKEVKNQLERRYNVLLTQLSDKPYSTLSNDYVALKKLTLNSIHNERKIILELRKTGEIHDEIFHLLSDELDLEELRSRTLRI
jgi:CPA1 family monovalent cation:H+ antiporter